MFTGLVEAVGRVVSVEGRDGGSVLAVERPEIFSDVRPADSVAVSGVCLTAVSSGDRQRLEFDVSPETLARSTLGRLRAGDRVNLERAMAADGRFGGHIVAGHVDATTRVERIQRAGDFWSYTFALDEGYARYVVEKGSIALDGISLTVAALRDRAFDVAVIPWTAERTTLGDRRAGEQVNLEVDVLGKYVERLLGVAGASRPLAGGAERDTRLKDLLGSR
jgi:riboflavin synthase